MGILQWAFEKLGGYDPSNGISVSNSDEHQILSLSDLPPASSSSDQFVSSPHDGDKFFLGFGQTLELWTDYWTLRKRSQQLYQRNPYARGLIRRLVTNEINTGLSLEAQPSATILGIDQDSINDWSENVEQRFELWSGNKRLCDVRQQKNFGALQREIRREALIEGDVLVVLRQSGATRLPMVEVITGGLVKNPGDPKPRAGNKIKHGVEIDKLGRHVAFYVDGKRVPAFGEKSGRRIAWLVYGTDKRHDEIRGQPILSLVLQSLNELDKYRDAATRKAVVNSFVSIWVEKTEAKMASRSVTQAAVRSDNIEVQQTDGSTRNLNATKFIPGIIADELQHGEKIHGFDSKGIDINFPIFEAAIISAIAWAQEIPPEILTLSFEKNYSASAAAIKEFKMYLEMIRGEFGSDLTQPIYIEWLISEVLNNKVQAPGLLEAWRNNSLYDIFSAWIKTEWYGSIKPSTDAKKEVQAGILECSHGLKTWSKLARELNGSKFSSNVQKLLVENAQIAELQTLLGILGEPTESEPEEIPEPVPLELIDGGG